MCEFNDGTRKIVGGRSAKPELLYNDFDLFMSIDEFSDRLPEFKKLNLSDLIDMAYSFYYDHNSNIVNLHIVNIETNEIIISKFK